MEMTRIAFDPLSAQEAQVFKMAREAVDAYTEWNAATDVVMAEFDKNPQAFRSLVQRSVEQLVRRACVAASSQSRQKIVAAASASAPTPVLTKKHRGGVERILAYASIALMDYPISGGTKLGDATKADIVTHAERQIKSAKENLHRGSWQLAVANRLPDGKRVRDVMTEADLKTLWDETNA